MKKRESVLIGIACVLFAGIIIYQVIGSPITYKAKAEKKPEIRRSIPETAAEPGREEKPAPEKEQKPEKEPEEKKMEETGKININEASENELTALDGIGEKKAKDIVDYRNENGSFKTVDELTEVKGIGEKTLEKLRSKIVV